MKKSWNSFLMAVLALFSLTSCQIVFSSSNTSLASDISDEKIENNNESSLTDSTNLEKSNDQTNNGGEIDITLDLTEYKYVKQLEWERTISRFMPYVFGASSNSSSSEVYKRCNLLFFSDSHIDLSNSSDSLENVRDTIDFANKAPFEISAIIHAGDAITASGNKEEIKDDFDDFAQIIKKSNYPLAFAKGNHDSNDCFNYPCNVFDENDFGDMIYNFAESNWGMVRHTKNNGKKSSYGFIDIDNHKIRIIIVDSQDTDKNSIDENEQVKYSGMNSYYISNEQLNWLANVALNFDDKEEKDWGVIVVSHQDYTCSTTITPSYESSLFKFMKICKAFNTQTHYFNTYTYDEDSFFNIDISVDYTRYADSQLKPHMICWLMGHYHEDRFEVVDGINMIWILNGSANNLYGDSRVSREPGTATQNAFDLVSIDTRMRKIRCIRYGAGVNCFGVGGDRFVPEGLSY